MNYVAMKGVIKALELLFILIIIFAILNAVFVYKTPVEGEVMCQILAETVDRKCYVLTDNIKSVDEANAELKAIIAKIQI